MEKVFNKVWKVLVTMNINESKRKVAMLIHFGGDYIPDIIDNAVCKAEGYDATIEYLNIHSNRKPTTLLKHKHSKKQFNTVMKQHNKIYH